MTLVEQLKLWEAAMTKAELDRALAFVQDQGWNPGDSPPAYIWVAAYRSVAPDKQPHNQTDNDEPV